VIDNPYRLPRAVIPSRYELRLEPDLETSSFAGTVAIAIDITEPVGELVLNAIELDITGATFVSGTDRTPLTVRLDAATERCVLTGPTVFGVDHAQLEVSFSGTLNDKLRGFYRSTFTDASGIARTVAATQMQATDCRRAFPCWDEPDFKAVFSVTMIVPEDLVAISNSAELRRSPAGAGKVAVEFADTIIMSTYLVAFIVGPLEMTDPIDVDGTELRVVHVPGKGHLTAFAQEIGSFALRWFQNYYGIAYPGDKVDLIALPDFAAGAMENLGCITFRENLLLVDPASATQAEEQMVADVVAHELAHMWFGDLVTMRWWNGIWLNEAFATFMEVAACDAFRADWQRWTSFSLDRTAAFEIDSLASTRSVEFEVVSPDDADGMFDVLTYEKGGALLRMLEQYLGAEQFRRGISHYLSRHAYSNTETSDLWDAIEETSGEPVRRIMDSWIWQQGYPVIDASIENGALALRQRRFRFDGADDATVWAVPLHIREHGTTDTTATTLLLDGGSATVSLQSPDSAVVVNAGSCGFFRVAYTPELLRRLTGPLLESLSTTERYSIIDDAWSTVVAGKLSAADFCTLAQGFDRETSVHVWQIMIAGLTWCDRFVTGAAREQFRGFIRGLVGPALERTGWAPTVGEGDLVGELRGQLIKALALLGHDSVARAECQRLHAAAEAVPGSVDPTVAAAALTVFAATGGPDEYESILATYRAATNPQEKLRYLHSLALVPHPEQILRTIALCFSDEVKTQNAPFTLSRMIGQRDHGNLAWQELRQRWDEATERFPNNTIVRMIDTVRTLTLPSQRAEVAAFFAEHDIPQSAKTLVQVLERQSINVSLRERAAQQLAAHFAP
jgi:puromycin-sensitive aminopeptidase